MFNYPILGHIIYIQARGQELGNADLAIKHHKNAMFKSFKKGHNITKTHKGNPQAIGQRHPSTY